MYSEGLRGGLNGESGRANFGEGFHQQPGACDSAEKRRLREARKERSEVLIGGIPEEHQVARLLKSHMQTLLGIKGC